MLQKKIAPYHRKGTPVVSALTIKICTGRTRSAVNKYLVSVSSPSIIYALTSLSPSQVETQIGGDEKPGSSPSPRYGAPAFILIARTVNNAHYFSLVDTRRFLHSKQATRHLQSIGSTQITQWQGSKILLGAAPCIKKMYVCEGLHPLWGLEAPNLQGRSVDIYNSSTTRYSPGESSNFHEWSRFSGFWPAE